MILTNAGGEGVLATDYAERYGLEVVDIPSDVQEELRKQLPPHVVTRNPIDLTGDTDDDRYRIALETVLKHDVVDAVILIAPPHPPAIRGDVIRYARESIDKYNVPVLAVVTGGLIAEEFAKKFEAVGIPAYTSPERAVKALAAMVKFVEARRRIAKSA